MNFNFTTHLVAMKLKNKDNSKGVKSMPYKRIVNQIKKEEGLGLVEVIASLGLAVIVITALVSLSIFTLRSSNKGKLLLRGTKIANQEIELVRAMRDSLTWTDFINSVSGCNSSSPCHITINESGNTYQIVSGAGSEGSGPTLLQYQFVTSDPINGDAVDTGDNVVRVDVNVSWDVGGDTQNTHIYTDISNWRNQ